LSGELAVAVGSSGRYKVHGSVAIWRPAWRFPRDPLPCDDHSVRSVHAYPFLEHLSGEDALKFSREEERLNRSVQYFDTLLQAHDLTYKSFWCEDTSRNTFANGTYDVDGNGQ
jgi:hypothetical protein